MFKFLTSRWIHIWIAMVRLQPAPPLPLLVRIPDLETRDELTRENPHLQGTLTTLATFTFTTNFKATSPFAHLLPSWSDLLTHPIDTISQAMHVYRMHVQHESMRVREQRHRRVEDAEKRRQYRIAHGLEEGPEKKEGEAAAEGADEQSPVAVDVATDVAGAGSVRAGADEGFVDWEGKRKHVKKWLGIW